MRLRHVFFSILLLLIGVIGAAIWTMHRDSTREVTQIPFERQKWLDTSGGAFEFRSAMVDDLLYTDTLRYLSKDDIITTLGKPTRTHANFLYYRINDTKLGLVTLRAKTLVIELDSTRNKVMIHG